MEVISYEQETLIFLAQLKLFLGQPENSDKWAEIVDLINEAGNILRNHKSISSQDKACIEAAQSKLLLRRKSFLDRAERLDHKQTCKKPMPLRQVCE
jgi:hypothetical protein